MVPGGSRSARTRSGLAAVGLGLAAIHGASDPFAGTLAAGAVAGEVAVPASGERRNPPRAPRSGTVARAVGLAAIAFGGIAFLLGRSGSSLCRPESVFQWHAVWHVLVAVALVAYAYAISVRRRSLPRALDPPLGDASTGVMTARLGDLADRTPSTRDRYVDFLRAVSILVVVVGHWTIALIIWDDGSSAPPAPSASTPWLVARRPGSSR